jgi:two-component system CheB/CheR fusion protein
LVIDRQHEILRFSGSEARHYLEPSPGAANLNLFSLLQKTLRPAVRSAVEQALATERTVINEHLMVQIDGKSRPLTSANVPGVGEHGPLARQTL